MSPPSVPEFINAAREFCAFAEDERDGGATDLWKVRDLLLRLIYHIPAVERAPSGAEHEGADPNDATLAKVAARFGGLRFNFYRVVFDPHNLQSNDEPVMGMLSDDLSDIYRDLATGLDNANRGHIDEACFDWAFSYRFHWARHAVGALAAIEILRTDSYEIIPEIICKDSTESSE